MPVSLGGFGERGLDAYRELLDDQGAELLAERYAGMRGDGEGFGSDAPAPGYVQRVLNGREDAGEQARLVEYVVGEVVGEAMADDRPAWAERLTSFHIPGLTGTYRCIGRGGYKHGHVDTREETVVLTFHNEDALRGELEQAEAVRHNMDAAAAHGIPVATRYQTVLTATDTGPKPCLIGSYRGDLIEPETYAEHVAREEGCSQELAQQAVQARVQDIIVEPLQELYEQGTVAYRSPAEIRMMDVLNGNVGVDPDTGQPYILDAGELGDHTFTKDAMPHNTRAAFLEAHGITERVDALLDGIA